jgi:2-iminobutanoate/2-iminopropanoate deaminase
LKRRIGREHCHATADHRDRERADFAALQPGRQGRTALARSGIVGIDPSTGILAGDTIQDQTRQALTNCEAILMAGGASLDDVIEVGMLLTNPADFAGLNEEYARWFPSEPPTRYVARLGVELPGVLISIRMAAFIT